jgi:hypothetical protein
MRRVIRVRVCIHFRWVDIVGGRGGHQFLPHGYAQVVSET